MDSGAFVRAGGGEAGISGRGTRCDVENRTAQPVPRYSARFLDP